MESRTIEQSCKAVVLDGTLTPSEVRMFFWVVLGGADFDALKLSRDTIDRGVSRLRKQGFIEPVGDWWRVKLRVGGPDNERLLFDLGAVSVRNPTGRDARLAEFSEAAAKFLGRPAEQQNQALRRWFDGNGQTEAVGVAVDASRSWLRGVPVAWSDALDEALVNAERWAAAAFGV